MNPSEAGVSGAWTLPGYLAEIIAEDPSVAKELLVLYLEDAAASVDRLNRLIVLGDKFECRKTLHSLKGSSLQIGALKLGGVAEGLEAKVIQGNFLASEDVLELKTSWESVRFEIERAIVSLAVIERLSP